MKLALIICYYTIAIVIALATANHAISSAIITDPNNDDFYDKSLIQKCSKGIGSSCFSLGYKYLTSSDNSRLKQALSYLNQGCELNFGPACNTLGNIYYNGNFVKLEKNKAIHLYQKACNLNFATACSNLANIHIKEKNSQDNLNTAIKLHNKACDLNNGFSCAFMGAMYSYGRNVELDVNKAIQLCKKGCDLDEGFACGLAGYFYQKGYGVPTDFAAAATLYKKGCALEDGTSCAFLGSIYEKGEVGTANLQKAFNLYKKGCDLNSGDACALLGSLYQNNNNNIDANSSQVIALYRKGCLDLQSARACNMLGDLYQEGIDVSRNVSVAALLYKKGCEHKDLKSCQKLVSLYSTNKDQLNSTTRADIESDIERLRTLVLSTDDDRNILNLFNLPKNTQEIK